MPIPPALDYSLTEGGRRQEPDGTTGCGEERLDEAWQQPEPLSDDAGLAWEAQQVFDYQVEALALEPMECLEHRVRGFCSPIARPCPWP
jgi:hypothetical protein